MVGMIKDQMGLVMGRVGSVNLALEERERKTMCGKVVNMMIQCICVAVTCLTKKY